MNPSCFRAELRSLTWLQDISASLPPTIFLPLVALPHIITSSLALSLLSDLLPRLSHSNPSVRKKTVPTLYRLALVYPDTLKSAWPKFKDLLMNEEEDSSVTAAVVNVVCELGWRRPEDFLALAPRLFNLLIEGGNNWMAIKIIKLFAILTPLEPRLIKKLLPPLTNLIRTTPAMSLLYECINGIVQGGILEGGDSGLDGDEIASLCVGKLRGMIVIEGDPNLKYVALLAFNRIVRSHPHLVSMQQDVIMSCIDDPDISIRLQALDLGAGMVSSGNLIAVVERLIQQLRNAPISHGIADDERVHAVRVEPAADTDGEDPEESLRPTKGSPTDAPALPTEYRITVIRRILQMCCVDSYKNIVDFEWYIKTLMQLVKLAPVTIRSPSTLAGTGPTNESEESILDEDICNSIGWELRNVAVRVSTVRAEAVQAANALMGVSRASSSFGVSSPGSESVLQYAAWIVGEYVEYCVDVHATIDAVIGSTAEMLPIDAICAYLQALPKVFARIVSQQSLMWNQECKTTMTLLLARIINFLEPLSTHPNLEVQERAVEFLELMRIASQAITTDEEPTGQAPLLLTRAIPELFTGFELNPVAPSAQRKVPLPNGLDLDTPINDTLSNVLQSTEYKTIEDAHLADFRSFYNEKPVSKSLAGPALDTVPSYDPVHSYQQSEEVLLDQAALAKKRMVRRERNRDDPFYIGGDDMSSGISTPIHDILKSSNGEIMDVDSIPIMTLDLGDKGGPATQSDAEIKQPKPRRPKRVYVIEDETIEHDSIAQDSLSAASMVPTSNLLRHARDRSKKSLLKVDSSSLGSFSLTNDTHDVGLEPARYEGIPHNHDSEMTNALAEVESLRLEMQRASERVQASDGTPAEGTLVKKKKRSKRSKKAEQSTSGAEPAQVGTLQVGNESDGISSRLVRTLPTKKKIIKKGKEKKVSVIEDADNVAVNEV